MEKELIEFNEALRGLRLAVRELRAQTLDTERAMSKAINGSHLRSILTLHSEDIFFRRLLETI